MLRLLRPHRARLAAEHGFTLIETLVALVTGFAVMGGLYAVLEVSLHQSTRVADVVQASQLGRTAMTHIVDELHSACLGPGFAPVQAKSTSATLIFQTGYSEKAELAEARQEEITWAGETLTEKTLTSNGGSWPNFLFTAPPSSTVVLGKNITQAEEVAKTPQPIFTYYKYSVTPSTATSAPSSTLEKMTVPALGFSAEEAAKVASVLIAFRAGPVSTTADPTRKVDLSSQVTFAFSAPSSEAPIEAAPCE